LEIKTANFGNKNQPTLEIKISQPWK